MDAMRSDLPAQREEVDDEGTDVPHVHITATTVMAPGPYWRDEYDIVHLVREVNPNYTMCHRYVSVRIIHGVDVQVYTDATPNCILCMVIER
jgi:hypothetical protein